MLDAKFEFGNGKFRNLRANIDIELVMADGNKLISISYGDLLIFCLASRLLHAGSRGNNIGLSTSYSLLFFLLF
jgi:hypothetical protein